MLWRPRNASEGLQYFHNMGFCSHKYFRDMWRNFRMLQELTLSIELNEIRKQHMLQKMLFSGPTQMLRWQKVNGVVLHPLFLHLNRSWRWHMENKEFVLIILIQACCCRSKSVKHRINWNKNVARPLENACFWQQKCYDDSRLMVLYFMLYFIIIFAWDETDIYMTQTLSIGCPNQQNLLMEFTMQMLLLLVDM